MTITNISVGQTGAKLTMAKGRLGRVKRLKKAGNRFKAQTRADQYQIPTSVSDFGTMERFMQQVGVERVDEANQIRRDVFNCLSLNDRVIDPGGRVVAKGATDEFEHPALDVLRKAGILDDPTDPSRAEQRVRGGVELLRMGVDGNVFPRSTAAWRDVNGGGGGGPPTSEADAEKYSARCEMRYLRGRDVVGLADWPMIRSVCIDGVVPAGTKRRRLCNALDLIAEEYLGVEPPRDVVRPRPRSRDRIVPAWLKSGK